VDAVLSIVVGSLAALGVAVLLLCILLLAERRSAEFTLLRARGASGRQLALLAARAGAISLIPARRGPAARGALVPSPLPMFADWWVPALIAMVVLAGPGVAAAVRYRARAAKSADRWSAAAVGVRTPRAGARRDRIRRAVGSAAAIVLCAARSRGCATTAADRILAAALTPFLIAVPIAIGNLLPDAPVVRALTHAAARRATRSRSSRWPVPHAVFDDRLAALARARLALAVVAVGSMVRDTVVSGEEAGFVGVRRRGRRAHRPGRAAPDSARRLLP